MSGPNPEAAPSNLQRLRPVLDLRGHLRGDLPRRRRYAPGHVRELAERPRSRAEARADPARRDPRRRRPRSPQAQRRADQDRRRQPQDRPATGERPRPADPGQGGIARSHGDAAQGRAGRAAPPAAKQQMAHKTIAGGPKGSEDVVAVVPTELRSRRKSLWWRRSSPRRPPRQRRAPPSRRAASLTRMRRPLLRRRSNAQMALLLGSAPSVDAVKLNWSILNDRHGDAVRNLHPRYVAQGKGAERTYALLAGPVDFARAGQDAVQADAGSRLCLRGQHLPRHRVLGSGSTRDWRRRTYRTPAGCRFAGRARTSARAAASCRANRSAHWLAAHIEQAVVADAANDRAHLRPEAVGLCPRVARLNPHARVAIGLELEAALKFGAIARLTTAPRSRGTGTARRCSGCGGRSRAR